MQCSETEMEKRILLLRDFQNGLTHFQARNNIIDQFGDCVGYSNQTCRRWFVKFKKGNFNLTTKPRDSKRGRDYRRRKRNKQNVKPVKMDRAQEVTIEQDKQVQPPPQAMPKLLHENATVQNLIQKKRELTISKVTRGAVVKKQAVEPNIITIAPSAKKTVHTPPTIPTTAMTPKAPKAPTPPKAPTTAKTPVIPMQIDNVPREIPNLRPRRSRPQGVNIKLPESAAERMIPQTSSENHSIGGGRTRKVLSAEKSKKTEKEVTVEFQNINPEVARNTVRKKPAVTNKRHTLPKQKPKNSTNNRIRTEPKEIPSKGSELKIVNVANVETICSEISKNTGQKIPEVINNLQTYSHLKPKNPIGNYGISAEPMDVSGTGLKIANVANVQSIISGISKTAVRKMPEVVNKRYTLPQDLPAPPPASPLNNQKGVIYLNPQQIFRQKFGDYKKPLKPPSLGMKSSEPALTKVTPFAQRQPTLLPSPPARQELVTLSDSDDSQDTEDDLLFPENIPLPAPKVKALTDTFTTYWDLESCTPISMDEPEPVAITITSPAVIEID